MRQIKEKHTDIPVVMLTAYDKATTAVEAMKSGADDYLLKDQIRDKLLIVAKNILKTYLLEKEVDNLKAQLKDWLKVDNIVGKCQVMQNVFSLLKKATESDITVLLYGESGTGKELFARALHAMSKRANESFIAIDCAVLPENLIESELFGYEKGTFTGATAKKLGRFELANNGTLFLDEIGNIPLSTQAKLLRTLEERCIERLGGKESVKINVKLIAATNVNLEEGIKNKTFREDLYYRINVFPIFIPPLRERKEDIPVLVEYFTKKFSEEQHKLNLKVSDAAMSVLISHLWPGNVRELKNAIERAVLLADKIIDVQHLTIGKPSFFLEGTNTKELEEIQNLGLYEASKKATKYIEKNLILKTLDESKGNKTKTAEKLKVDYKTLLTKLKEYAIK